MVTPPLQLPEHILAIIPARGGSKTLPRKNIKALRGAPLISYSIVAALQSKTVTRVIVSTDDEEIATIARQWGADVPFLRPVEYAQDMSLDIETFQHALHWLAEHEDYHPDFVAQLRPTSPLRPPDVIDSAVTLLAGDPTADSVRGVVPSGQNPYKMWRIPQVGAPMQPLIDTDFVEPYNMPRQELPDSYFQTGHIDVIRAPVITEQNSMSGQRILPLIIDPRYTIDIDSMRDWDRAEWMLQRLDMPYVQPSRREQLLGDVRLLALDFDGVLTDDRVWTAPDGTEMVAANRSDGMGVGLARGHGVEVVVISREANPVVQARCRKLGVECRNGVLDKAPLLRQMVDERGLAWSQVVYVGNDVNDLDCMKLAGCGVAVNDAHESVLVKADIVLTSRGGHGAVRELCDEIIRYTPRRESRESNA
jgi:N-acylneuraminate cytidylyltransferase